MQIRIGINENTDNLVIDINGKLNVAGAGVNMAQRIMNLADGGQILIGEAVYEILKHREKYMKSFNHYRAKVKHGYVINVHQYINDNCIELNNKIPSIFQVPQAQKPKLTRLAAYYFAYTILIKENIKIALRVGYSADKNILTALWFLARDADSNIDKNEYEEKYLQVYGEGKLFFEDIIKYYSSQDYYVMVNLCDMIVGKHLSAFREYFENTSTLFSYHILNDAGIKKLKDEFPGIWKEFDLDKSI